MSSHETLRPYEQLRSTETPHARESRVTDVHAEAIYAKREAMLAELMTEIGSGLYDALAQKIQHERIALLGIIEEEHKIRDAKRRLDKVLKSEYFVYRKLDTNLL